MKQLNKKSSTLYLLLLCIITVAIACLLTVNRQPQTAFADTESEPTVLDDDCADYNVSISAATTTIVVFDTEGGEGGSEYVMATYGEPMPEATAPTLEYHNFKGYFSGRDGTGTQYYDENMNSVHNWDRTSMTYILYAYWEAETFTVYFDKQGGEGGSDYVVVGYGESMPEDNMVEPDKTGYEFQGYFSKPYGEGDQYYKKDMTSANKWNFAIDAVLYANWEPKKYHIDFIRDPGSGGTSYIYQTYGEEMDTATAPTPLKGYEFEGYYLEPAGQGTKYYNYDMSSAHIWDIPQDSKLYANYTEIEIDVTFDVCGGALTVGDRTYSFYTIKLKYSETLNLDNYIPIKTGYQFGGWYLNDKKESSLTNQDENITLTAKWSRRIDADVYTMEYRLNYLLLSDVSEIILVLPSRNFLEPCHIIIPARVKQVHIYSTTYIQYDLYITIESRSTDLDLLLENFAMCAPVLLNSSTATGTAYDAIEMKTTNDEATLNLYAYGKVSIFGATSNVFSGYYYNGGNAIDCQKVDICVCGADSLTIYGGYGGGKGGNGAKAISGEYDICGDKSKVHFRDLS